MRGQRLRVFTLNAWGVPVVQDLDARMKTLAMWLEKNPKNVDVVALQEVFREKDVELLLAHARRGPLRYAHVASAGPGILWTNSPGCMIFSRYPIEDTAYHRYGVNGKPQRLHHLDWWVGKGVVLARLAGTPVGPVDVYVTHTVAAYVAWNREGESDEALARRDEYAAQRVLQAYECVQWIQLTRREHAGCVLLGDLNAPPTALSTQVLQQWGRFQDVHSVDPQPTYLPESSKYHHAGYDISARLDYIFAAQGQWMTTESWISFAHPDEISDHVGVGAELERLAHDEVQNTSPEFSEMRTRVELMLRMGLVESRHARWLHRAWWIGSCVLLLLLRAASVSAGPWLEWLLLSLAWSHFCIACTACNDDLSAYMRTLQHLLLPESARTSIIA